MIHTIENNQLRICINDHGAELTEIYDKEKDRQILWTADPRFWNRHAPVLFPNVGRYYENHCLINGVSYESGQHGFAMMQNQNIFTVLFHRAHLMTAHDYVALFTNQILQQPSEHLRIDWIQTTERLIQENQLWIMNQSSD